MPKMKPLVKGGSISIGGQTYSPGRDGNVDLPTLEHVKIAQSHGFTLVPDAPVVQKFDDEENTDDAPKNADEMTGAEIKAYIEANKIEVPSGTKLAGQRTLVQEHMDAAAAATA